MQQRQRMHAKPNCRPGSLVSPHGFEIAIPRELAAIAAEAFLRFKPDEKAQRLLHGFPLRLEAAFPISSS